jgi:hypothetical protein
MWKTSEGSTGRLLQLCLGYFVFYVVTGVTVKYFTGSAASGYVGMKDLQFLVYSTTGGTGLCLLVVLALGWYRLESNGQAQLGPFRVPGEFLYIIPSGVCTAVVIPTTTLMYMLPISVRVAMVIMRGGVIVISRLVDELQIRQGILKKRVYWQENVAVLFALVAMSVNLFWEQAKGGFDFLGSKAAVGILASYMAAYFLRIYIMNYFKNTRAKGVKLDNNGFFGVEQIAAFVTMLLVTLLLYYAPDLLAWQSRELDTFRGAISGPHPQWAWALLAGSAFGVVAFFSVFLFMFKGRTATFAGLVNRLTSLVAGTTATLVFHFSFGGKPPKPQDWASLGFILVAVAFLSSAERRRAVELEARHELATTPEEAPSPHARASA